MDKQKIQATIDMIQKIVWGKFVKPFVDFKNPFDTDAAAVTSTGTATASTDKGYVRVIASSNTLTITTCFDNSTDTSGSDCSVAADRVENTVDVN